MQIRRSRRATWLGLADDKRHRVAALLLAACCLLATVLPELPAQDAPKSLAVKLTATLAVKDHVDVLTFHKDNKTLVSLSGDTKPGYSIKLWNVATGQNTATFPSGDRMALSSDGKTIAIGWTDESKIELRDLTNGKTNQWSDVEGDGAISMAFSPDGKTLALGSKDLNIRLWDVATRKLIGTLTGHTHWVRSVTFSADGKTLVSASRDGSARLWDVATGKNTQTFEEGKGNRVSCNAAVFNSDSKFLAVGVGRVKDKENTGEVKIWDVATSKNIHTLTGHPSFVSSVAFRKDSNLLASADWDGKVKLWNLTTGKELITLAEHSGPVWSVTFSPDGQKLATGGYDGTIKLWDIPDRAHLVTRLELERAIPKDATK